MHDRRRARVLIAHRAPAGMPPIITFVEPIAIASAARRRCTCRRRAPPASRRSGTVGAPGGMIGPPTCGFGPVRQRAACACRRRGRLGASAPIVARARRARSTPAAAPTARARRPRRRSAGSGRRRCCRPPWARAAAPRCGRAPAPSSSACGSGTPAAGWSATARRRRAAGASCVAASSGSATGTADISAPVYGMRGWRVELVGVGQLDDLAEVHHRDAVAHVAHDGEVVGDEDQRQPELALQVAQQVEDLRLDRHVERGDRLVGDDQLRLERERARDADALALAAGELVRIAVVVLGVEPDACPSAPGPRACARPCPRACRGSRTARR